MAENNAPAKAPADALARAKGFTFRDFILNYYAIVFLVILFIVACFASPLFLTTSNMNTVMRQQGAYILIALGMLMIIITGGIDLAASATVALSSILMVVASSNWGFGTLGAICMGLIMGLVIGAFNGVCVAWLRIPAFIVTLALSYIGQGIAFMITKGNTLLIDTTSKTYTDLVYPGFASMSIASIPLTFVVAIVFFVIFLLLMKYTKFGRLIYAVGSNENAVRLAGINSKKILFLVYLLEGFLCAVAGVLLTSRTGNASALTCSGDYALSTVAAVVIGGASLAGGEGTVIMTAVGVFVIAIIGNIMNLIGLPSYPQMVVKGAVIILAVVLKGFSSKNQG